MTANGTARDIVRDNSELRRFELQTAAGPAVAEYHQDGDTLVLFYTEVPSAMRGRGIGEKLVRGVLLEIRRRKLKIDPRCSFVRAFIDRHPEFQGLIA